MSASNLERAQNLADAGRFDASIARSLITIAAALSMQVEKQQEPKVMMHKDWCEDPTCGNKLAHIGVDQ